MTPEKMTKNEHLRLRQNCNCCHSQELSKQDHVRILFKRHLSVWQIPVIH
jgi:hypothetical protein